MSDIGVSRQVIDTSDFAREHTRWCRRPVCACDETGYYELRWKPFEVDGNFEICGTSRYSGRKVERLSRRQLSGSVVPHEGRTILSELRFFQVAEGPGSLEGRPGNCRPTVEPVPAGPWNVCISIPASAEVL